MPALNHRAISTLIVAIWLAGILSALWTIEAYKATPGKAGSTPARAPQNTVPDGVPGRLQLIMFVHPQCPCSRASLAELTEILAEEPSAAAVEIVFVRPPGAGSTWNDTPLWTAATQLAGVRVSSD